MENQLLSALNSSLSSPAAIFHGKETQMAKQGKKVFFFPIKIV